MLTPGRNRLMVVHTPLATTLRRQRTQHWDHAQSMMGIGMPRSGIATLDRSDAMLQRERAAEDCSDLCADLGDHRAPRALHLSIGDRLAQVEQTLAVALVCVTRQALRQEVG